MAAVAIRRYSNSTDSANVLNVTAYLWHCGDADCLTGDSLGSLDLGSVKKGHRVKLLLEWDPDNDRFMVQRDHGQEEYLYYTVPDSSPAGYNSKRVEISNFVTNCLSTPRLAAFMDTFIDDVYVNESALLP